MRYDCAGFNQKSAWNRRRLGALSIRLTGAGIDTETGRKRSVRNSAAGARDNESAPSVFYFKTANGRPWSGTAGVIRADSPPHSERWQRVGTELRRPYRLIHDQRRKKSVLIVNLDGVTGRSGDISPIERDVCSRSEARIGRRRDERRRSQARCG